MFLSKLRYGITRTHLDRITADWLHGKLLSLSRSAHEKQFSKKSLLSAFTIRVDEILASHNVDKPQNLPQKILIRLNALHHVMFAEDSEIENNIIKIPPKDQAALREIMAETLPVRIEIQRDKEHEDKILRERAEAVQNFNQEKLEHSYFSFGSGQYRDDPRILSSRETWSYAKKKCNADFVKNPKYRFVLGLVYLRTDPASTDEFDQILKAHKNILFLRINPLDGQMKKRWSPGHLRKFMNKAFGGDWDYYYIQSSKTLEDWEFVKIANSQREFEKVYCDVPTHFAMEIDKSDTDARGVSVAINGNGDKVCKITLNVSGDADKVDIKKQLLYATGNKFINKHFRINLNQSQIFKLEEQANLILDDINFKYLETISRPHWSVPDQIDLTLSFEEYNTKGR